MPIGAAMVTGDACSVPGMMPEPGDGVRRLDPAGFRGLARRQRVPERARRPDQRVRLR